MHNRKELLAKWRQLSVKELNEELEQLVKQQFKLKMQQVIGELKSLHHIKMIRRNIARLLSVLKEKEAN